MGAPLEAGENIQQRVREEEHSSFTPIVMSLTGGLGYAATKDWHHYSWQNMTNTTIQP